MPSLQVFDPAMCCSTGVCGPTVDPVLPRFAGDLEFLVSQGVQVTRHNLVQEPGAFTAIEAVKQVLNEKGTECLPILVVDGKVVSEGRYPERGELLDLIAPLADPRATSSMSPLVQELIALAVAFAAHSNQAFRFHVERAKELGATKADLTLAVETALRVQDGATRATLQLAGRHLGLESASSCEPGSGCC